MLTLQNAMFVQAEAPPGTAQLPGIVSTLLGALSLAVAALLVKVCATALHLDEWRLQLIHGEGGTTYDATRYGNELNGSYIRVIVMVNIMVYNHG